MKRMFYLVVLYLGLVVGTIYADITYLDTTFGPSFTGVVTTAIGNVAQANAVLVQADGLIVPAGTSDNKFAIARYSSSGVLDTAGFANPNGFTTTAIGTDATAAGVVQQTADSKLVAAGLTRTGSVNSFALTRYTTAGVLDVTFDTDGIQTTLIGSSSGARSVNVQTILGTAYIVAAGYSLSSGGIPSMAVARYLQSNGALDTAGFNAGGGQPGTNTLLVGQASTANASAIQTDNKIVLAGYGTSGATPQVLVARFTSAGVLDTATFGGGLGYVLTNVVPGMIATSVGLQTIGGNAGKIIVAGAVNGKATLIRFTTAGAVDTTFGTDGDGAVRTSIGTSTNVTGLTVQSSNDAIVITGFVDEQVFVARYTAAGVLDSTFGSGGIAIVNACPSGTSQGSQAVALQTDNKPVIAGYCENSFMVARFLASGSRSINNVEFGNTALVDKIFGNDTTGSVNGTAFLTISAALTAASTYFGSTGFPVTVLVYPGTYNESITIPANISVKGMAQGSLVGTGSGTPQVLIQKAAVTATTTLVTMNTNSSLEDVNLNLTTATNGLVLTGISFASGAVASAAVRRVILNVNNVGTNSQMFGVDGNTGAGGGSIDNVESCIISLTASGASGAVRGITAGNGGAAFRVRNTTVTASGGTSTFGVSGGTPGSITLNGCSISGTSTDIFPGSDTSFSMGSTSLANFNSNNLGFTNLLSPSTMMFGLGNGQQLPAGATRFMLPGNVTAAGSLSTVETTAQFRFSQACLLKAISYHAGTAPTVGHTDTFTVRKNAANTAVTLTINAGVTSATSTANSASFAAGDLLALQVVTNAGAGHSIDFYVTLEFY